MFERFFRNMGSGDGDPIQRRGLARVLEIILDNLTRLLVSSLLCLVCLIPWAAAVLWAVSRGSAPELLAAGFVGGLLFGPAYGAMVDGMLYAVRDVPGDWWHTYCRAWRRDWRGNLIPGGLTGVLAALAAYEGIMLGVQADFLPLSVYVSTGLALAVALTIFTYFWPQRAFTDLNGWQLFRNSRLMILMHPVTALKALLIQLLYWAALIVAFPYSAIALPLLGLWFPALTGLLIIYPQLNEDLKMEQRLEEEGRV